MAKTMPLVQTQKNKKGEVIFRKKLAEQFLGKTTHYPGEPTSDQYKSIIRDRIKDYTNYFKKLQKKNIPLGPYLELGAGVGQGAMLLQNSFTVQGFTSDISYETLQLADTYKKQLRYKKMPIRICCDLYNLPFRSGSIPFIFTFQTLHHLPDPYPALKEINRVLAPAGFFYFNEEPISQWINLNLWRRDRNLRWFEKILKMFIILHFISRIGKSETDHNILEETFSLDTWKKALDIFDNAEVNLSIFPFGLNIHKVKNDNSGWIKPAFFKLFFLGLLGGGIEAICKKEDAGKKHNIKSLFEILSCPNCRNKPSLKIVNEGTLHCLQCKSYFRNKNGVYILLSKKQEKFLYA